MHVVGVNQVLNEIIDRRRKPVGGRFSRKVIRSSHCEYRNHRSMVVEGASMVNGGHGGSSFVDGRSKLVNSGQGSKKHADWRR
ncbi:hypothetical protein U1Q18_031215, partial [Sarracenia purpurea var. burkii]